MDASTRTVKTTEDPSYEEYLQELDDLTLFRYAERSHASRISLRGRGWLKAPDRDTSELLEAMGKMIRSVRSLLDVALAVVKSCNPHASRAEWSAKLFESARLALTEKYDDVEWSAKLFESARLALTEKYDDVERRSGPESVRLSDCVRPYTRSEKLIVLCVLDSLGENYTGLGWAAQRCADELGVTTLILDLTGRSS